MLSMSLGLHSTKSIGSWIIKITVKSHAGFGIMQAAERQNLIVVSSDSFRNVSESSRSAQIFREFLPVIEKNIPHSLFFSDNRETHDVQNRL